MKKNPKDKNAKQIPAKLIKDIVPSNYNHVHENVPIVNPSTSDKVYYPETMPNVIPEEWPTEDILQPPGEEETEVFKDPNPEKIFLPYSLYHHYLFDEVKWERPNDYIKENHLDKAIMTNLPNRNNIKFRITVHEMYEKEKERKKKVEEDGYYQEDDDNSEDSLGFEKKDKLSFYRDYFKILETPVKIQVVNFFQREETDEEYEQRIKREEEEIEKNKKEAKNKKKTDKNDNKDKKPELIQLTKEKLLINEANPGNISMKDEYPLYCKWIASIFQIIKDREIVDVNTKETIWQKIYPQKNGIPIYNPTGKYWVKLYHFGKPRKIEIDDFMPCSKYDQFYLPRCQMLEEIWPAILTKAIIKLYSFKIVSTSFKECGDYSPFYALTGYVPEMIYIERDIYKMFENKETLDANTLNDTLNHEVKEIKGEKNKPTDTITSNENSNEKNEQNLNNNEYSNVKIIELPEKEQQKIINSNNNEEDSSNIASQNLQSNVESLKPPTKPFSSTTLQSPLDTYVSPSKLKFLQFALSDAHYNSKQCILLCYHKGEDIVREDNNIIGQKIYKTELQRSDNRLNRLKQPLHRVNSINTKSSKSLLELKRLRGLDKLSPQMNRVIEELDNSAKPHRFKKKNSTNLIIFKDNALLRKSSVLSNKSVNEDIKAPTSTKNMFENKVHVGFLYNVIEFFDNKKFNMKRLLPIDFSDLKAMVKQLNTTYVFKQLPREEKKIYIQKLKEIKQIQKQEKAKRIENLKLNGQTFTCVKIGNNAIDDPHFFVIHSNEEIEMTKKCLLNNWAFPPISFLDKIYTERQEANNQINKSKNKEESSNKSPRGKPDPKSKGKIILEDGQIEVNEDLVKLNSKNNRTNSWNKDIYYQLINNDIEQYNNPKEPLIREKGTWIEPCEFFHYFNSFIMLYNPSLYKTAFVWDNLWHDTSDAFSVNNNNKVIRLFPSKIESNNVLNEENKDTSQENQIKNYMVLLFAANSDVSNKYRDIPYGIHFELVSKNQKLQDAREISINSFFGSKHIDGIDSQNEYFLIFRNGIFPVGFIFLLLSDFQVEPMTYSRFLSEHSQYKSNKFKIEHAILTKNEPFVILRLDVNVVFERERFIIVTNQTDKYAIDFTEIVICDNNNGDVINKKRKINFDSMFELKKGKYVIVVVVIPPYNLNEASYEIEVLHKEVQNEENVVDEEEKANDNQQEKLSTIEQIESILPYEITDNYQHNKHYILFKEYLFSGDKIFAFLNIRLRKLVTKDSIEIEPPKKEKNQIEVSKTEEVEICDKIRMKLEIYSRENTLLYETDFYNSITLHNIVFEGNTITEVKKDKNKKNEGNDSQPGNIPYRMLCYLDSTELPPSFNTTQFQNGFGWKIRVFASDTLAFAKDTSKEDRERELINSWEVSEPGRAEKAQKSRRRFLLEQQKLNGKQLTEEEEKFLSIPRARKTTKETTPVTNEQKGKKKNDKKKKEEEKEENSKESVDPKYDINFSKKTDQVEQHSSMYIKNFLYYAYDNRLIKYDNKYQQEEKELNTEVLKTQKEEKIISLYEQSKCNTIENMDDTNYRNELLQNSKKFKENIISSRKKDTQKIESALKAREDLKKLMKEKQEAENKLQDLLNQEQSAKNDPKAKFDLNNAINVYKEVQATNGDCKLLKQVILMISQKKEEIIKGDIKKIPKGKEKEFKATAKKHLEDIKENKWIISEELLTQLTLYAE